MSTGAGYGLLAALHGSQFIPLSAEGVALEQLGLLRLIGLYG